MLKLNTYQQFNFFTLSKSGAFALARTSLRVSFIANEPTNPSRNNNFNALFVHKQLTHYDRLYGQTFQLDSGDVVVHHINTHAQIYWASLVTVISCIFSCIHEFFLFFLEKVSVIIQKQILSISVFYKSRFIFCICGCLKENSKSQNATQTTG